MPIQDGGITNQFPFQPCIFSRCKMIKLLLALALIVGLSSAGPLRSFQVRRLDPSKPEEIEDFEVSEDEDPESIVIDAAESDGEFPDSPPPSVVDSGEYENGKYYLTQRQESRLERISSNYEQLTGQESQIYAGLQLSEANQAELQSSIKENEADARDLRRFSDWLSDEAQAQHEFAEELEGTPDASREAKLGDILEEMSQLASHNAELEREAVDKQEKQVDMESAIRREQEEEVGQRSNQAELQIDQIYLEHQMIDNENQFKELDRQLFQIADGDDNGEDDGYIGMPEEDGENAGEEPQPYDQAGSDAETAHV